MRISYLRALRWPLLAALLAAPPMAVAGSSGCDEENWTVYEETTLSITTSGAYPYQDVEVDIEVTPLLAELGWIYVDIWMEESVLPEAEHPRVVVSRYDDDWADGGVDYSEPIQVGWYFPRATSTSIHVECTGDPCRATVPIELRSATPRTFTIHGAVVVEGPDDGDPAPGRIYATWRTLP